VVLKNPAGAILIASVLFAGIAFSDRSFSDDTESSSCQRPVKQPSAEASAENFVDPSVIVTGFYTGQSLDLTWVEGAGPDSGQMSERLLAAYVESQRTYNGYAITFDPVVNGQDALIEDLVVHAAVIDGSRAYVNVRFRNFDTDNVLVYSFVCEDRFWRLDELASIGGEVRWVFSDVLQNP